MLRELARRPAQGPRRSLSTPLPKDATLVELRPEALTFRTRECVLPGTVVDLVLRLEGQPLALQTPVEACLVVEKDRSGYVFHCRLDLDRAARLRPPDPRPLHQPGPRQSRAGRARREVTLDAARRGGGRHRRLRGDRARVRPRLRARGRARGRRGAPPRPSGGAGGRGARARRRGPGHEGGRRRGGGRPRASCRRRSSASGASTCSSTTPATACAGRSRTTPAAAYERLMRVNYLGTVLRLPGRASR